MKLRHLGLAPIVKWDCWNGTSYTCLPCYEKSLTATATTCLTSTVTVYEVPIGSRCSGCDIDLEGREQGADWLRRLERVRDKHERTGGPDEQELADQGFSS